MTVLKRPDRTFSFSDWTRMHPREPVPGDRLDTQFHELIEAIATTQAALGDLRRDDGALKNASVGQEQLIPGLRETLIGDVAAQVEPIQRRVDGVAAAALDAQQNAQLYAADAERAVEVVRKIVSATSVTCHEINDKANLIARTSAVLRDSAAQLDNAASWADAQSDNAEKFKNEALQWAEYLAGPVVDAASAPAYIASSPFPRGLYYQPVEGGLAGMWSSKWWAIWAQQMVNAAYFYLGAQGSTPIPGATNPNTGQAYPSPLLPGSFYFNTSTNTLMVWNGMSWQPALALAPGYQAQYFYRATPGQIVFSGPDLNGVSPSVGNAISDVYVNGLRLTPLQFTVNAAANSLTIPAGVPAGQYVQWDLLVAGTGSGSGSTAVNAVKINTLTPNGFTSDFALAYNDATGTAVPTNIVNSVELMVSLDGVIQEPGVDFTANAATLHMAAVPPGDSTLWAVWYSPSPTTPTAPVNVGAPVITGEMRSSQTLSTSNGAWSGTAPINFTYQWQANSTNIAGATMQTFTLTNAQVGTMINCIVHGTNAITSASASSNVRGPVWASNVVMADDDNAVLGSDGTPVLSG